MAKDRFGNVVRALALLGPGDDRELMLVQQVVNQLISPNREEFSAKLTAFLGREEHTLYVAPPQRKGSSMNGWEVLKHLQARDYLKRAYCRSDDLVQRWLRNPVTYPGSFKKFVVMIWGSNDPDGQTPGVSGLTWKDDQLVIQWVSLDEYFTSLHPALLRN